MRILLVEDESEIAGLLSRRLGSSGFAADCVASIYDARTALAVHAYSFVLLDRRLPDGDGIVLVSEIRSDHPSARIVMLTACDETEAIVAGLDAGADDYVTKPFDSDELMARIRACFRRSPTIAAPAITIGNLSFDPYLRDISIHGKSRIFHGRELMLLETLIRHAGRMVSRQALIDEIYGFAEEVQPSVLNLLVLRLRRHLAELDAGVTIHAARGVGYMLSKATP